jgi:hypothetical protein
MAGEESGRAPTGKVEVSWLPPWRAVKEAESVELVA